MILPRCLRDHSSKVLDLLVHLLQSLKESSISLVKSSEQHIVPGGAICYIKCSIDRNIINSRITLTFQPDSLQIWEDIIPLQSSFMMKTGVQTHIHVSVLSKSHHDTVLLPNFTIASFHQIQSISPIELLKLTDNEKQ